MVGVEHFEWTNLPPHWRMESHGHVAERPDRFVARCGGPSLCSLCRLERDYLRLLGWYEDACGTEASKVAQMLNKSREV